MPSYRRTFLALVCCALPMQFAVSDNLEVAQYEGVSVAFNLLPTNHTAAETAVLRAGDSVTVQFRVEDLNHAGLGGLFPAAWIHPSDPSEASSDELCLNKTKTFIGGSLLSRAAIDLNVYYVLVLNNDASVSVVDPLFGFGGSKLLTMLPLDGVGFDWVVSPAQNHVYVSLPEQNKIAEINTANWQVTHHTSDGNWHSPKTLALPSGQRYLWTLVNNGVVVHDPEPFHLKTMIKTPGNPIALTFSADQRYAFVLDKDQLTVIDAHSLTVSATIKMGDGPVAMDYADLADDLYVAHANSGEIWVIDGREFTTSTVITSEKGISSLRFAPDGRLGFLLNPVTDHLSIIDAAQQNIVQQGRVAGHPDYIAFSEQLAYIRHRESSDLLMVALDDQDLGRAGTDISTIDTPGGDQPAGLIDVYSAGEGIVQAPGSNAVLVANYRDKAVYFYKEGMAAPMGQFGNYGKSPRAIVTVDKSLRERNTPGVYSTTAVLPEAGQYQAVFFMDSPRVVHCFSFQVAADLQVDVQSPVNDIVIQQNAGMTDFKVGETATIVFKALYKESGTSIRTETVDVSIILASGLWRHQLSAVSDQEGQISVKFIPPLPGAYDIYLSLNHDTVSLTEKFTYDVSR